MKAFKQFLKRTLGLSVALLLGSLGTKAQVSLTQNFDGCSANPCSGWEIVGGYDAKISGTSSSGYSPCSNVSATANIYSFDTLTALSSTSSVGTSTGQSTTFNFTYKCIEYSSGSATTAGSVSFNVQYASSATGPWTTISTFTNVSSTTCVTSTHTFTPPTGAMYVRILAYTTSSSVDCWVVFDNISIQETLGNCSGTVSAGTLTGPTTICPSTNFTITGTGGTSTAYTGIAYQWQSSTTGAAGSWTNITGATSMNLSTSQTTAKYYRRYVTCSFSSSSDTSSSVLVGMSAITNCYCSPTNMGGALIDSVGFAGISNNTSATNPTAIPFYSQFTQTASVYKGNSYPLSIKIGSGAAIASVWIDYNRNGIFEASEWTQIGTNIASSSVATISLAIPTTADTGVTGMRIRTRSAGNTNGSGDACTSMGSGETEDYLVHIQSTSACTGSVAGGTATSNVTIACPSTSINLNATGATPYTAGIIYQWQKSATGAVGTWSNIAGATSLNYTTTQTSATFYRLVVVCSTSTTSDTSTSVSVAQDVATNCYCIPSSTTSSTYIDSLKTTGGLATNITNNATGYGTAGYQNFYNTHSVTSYAGGVFTVQTSVVGGSLGTAIWIDWNNNGTFETTERVYNTTGYGYNVSANITVPSTVAQGNYRMRIMVDWNNSSPSNPCISTSRMEAEDYKLVIGTPPPPPSCVASPTAPALNSSFCQTTTGTTLSWPAATNATSYTVWLTLGATPIDSVATVTTTTYTTPAALAPGSYAWKIVPKNIVGAATGCSTFNFTVLAKPTVTITPASPSICSGSSTSLTASGASTYTWTPTTGLSSSTGATVTASPTATTTYTVTGTATNTCTNTATATVTVNPMPSQLVIAPAYDSICTGETVLLQTSGGTVSANATIGTGTSALSSTSYPNPLSAFYGGAKHQMIYTAAELTAQGLGANSSINSVALNLVTFAANAATDLTIRMKQTSSTTLSGFETGMTTVYGPTTYTPSATGWATFTLTQPIVWNGTSNIIVEFVHNSGNYGNGSGTTAAYSITSTNMTYYGASDAVSGGISGFDALSSHDVSGTSTSRPNIRFGYSQNASITWSPSTALYTDAAATIAYTGTNTDTVYAKPTTTTSYIATATTLANCTRADTVVITVSTPPTVALGNDTSFCAGDSVLLSAGNAGMTYLWSTGDTTQTIYAATSGTYWAKVTNASSCSATDTLVVTVDSLPIVSLGSDTAICEDDTLTLDAGNAGATYLWNDNSTAQTLSVTAAGTFWVKVTNTNGCSATDSVTITENPLPSVDSLTFTVNANNMYTFTGVNVANATSYLWNFGDGATATTPTATHTYTQAGTYIVSLTVSNDCGSVTVTKTITRSVGIKDLTLSNQVLFVYPNPTQHTLTIKNESNYSMEKAEVFNLIGQKVMDVPVMNGKLHTIDVSKFASGMYHLRISMGDAGTVTRKFEVIK